MNFKIINLTLLFLLIASPVFAGDFVCHDGTGFNLYKRLSRGKGYSMDLKCIRADRNTVLTDKKIESGQIVDMTQEEIDARDQAIADAQAQTLSDKADKLNFSMEDVITALVKVINVRLPAGQKITKKEIVSQLKSDLDI